MFESKSALILSYLGLVGTACLWPFLLQIRPRWPWGRALQILLWTALPVGAVLLLANRGAVGMLAPVVLASVIVLPLFRLGVPAVLAGICGVVFLSTLLWWAPAAELSLAQGLAFVLIGLGAALLPWLSPTREGLPTWPSLALLAAAGLAAVLGTGVFSVPVPFLSLWHHWGAYVAPAEALLAGGVPFRDFTVQYGMGPTLLLAGLCGSDCWPGMFGAVAAVNLIHLFALGGCVLLLTRRFPRGLALLALLAMMVSALVWTGYPPNWMGWMIAPSVGGMRFAPLSLLLLHILWTEAGDRPNDAVGHSLWLFGLAWSPETGFFCSLVWWPYLALREAQLRTGTWPVILALIAGGARAVLATLAGLALLVVVFRLGFGDWPSIYGFLAYVRNPPGVLPPNALGPVWLVPITAGLALFAASRADGRGVRTIFVCLAAFLGTVSYYLGRSHDNNVLNLLPFMVLALVAAMGAGPSSLVSGFSRTVMCGLVALIVPFGHDAWNEAAGSSRWRDAGSSRLLAQMRLEDDESQRLVDRGMAAIMTAWAPAADASTALRALDGEAAPVLITAFPLLPRVQAGRAWTGVNSLANYGDLPPSVIEHFVRRGAAAYRRAGWLLVDQTQPGPWLDYFRAAYDVAEERGFGGFTAYRLVPR